MRAESFGKTLTIESKARIEKKPNMELDERQKRLLKLTFLDYQHNADFAANPLVVARAKGLYYWDVEGKRYFDGIAGVYAATLGHGHPG